MGMSRPKRWMKAISDGMGLLQAARDAEELNQESLPEDVREDVGELQMTEEAAAAVEAALSEISDLKSEYEDWMGNMPDSLQSSPTYERLQEVCDLDTDFDEKWTFDEAQGKLEELDGVELPRGFGKD